jgi:hypothetical protein
MVKRQLLRRGWEKPTYQDLVGGTCPLGKLVTCLIARAILDRATKIMFGLPPGHELNREDVAEIHARDEEYVRNTNAATKTVCQESGDESNPLIRDGFVTFHRRDGLPEVPCWHEIDGQWFRYPGIPARFYPYLPQHLCERLVSLDMKPLEGGKEEWIEYTSSIGDGDDRKFVRVDLVLEANNSVTVDLLQNRVECSDVAVWWRHRKV